MARPKLNCRVERISLRLSLREGRDDDLILFFESVPPNQRASAVTAALRSGGVALGSVAGSSFSEAEKAELFGVLDEMEW